MTQKQYLDELKRELELNNVEEIEDILSEYEDHFYYKKEEGYTEEEIVRKLSSPEEIAREYASRPADNAKSGKALKIAGVSVMSVILAPFYILVWAAVIALGVFTVATATLGVCLVTTINIADLIPYLPYFSSLTIGIACFGLSVLSAMGTFLCFGYAKHWGKMYFVWCKDLINGNRYLSGATHPYISKKVAGFLKLIAVIGLICFLAAMIVGYFSMCIAAKSFEPWHVWNWFM